jgi:hypothetical protein
VTHTAVSISEPAGKPVKHCKMVPVRLTLFHAADVKVHAEQGPVELREIRLLRLCLEAFEQRAPLAYEDLSVLLGIDLSTVKDIVKRLRERGLVVPTRGAVKDIGPEPSHKRVVAEMLARGYTTSKIRAVTKHSEHAIGRYQHDFAVGLIDFPGQPRKVAAALVRGVGVGAQKVQHQGDIHQLDRCCVLLLPGFLAS